jgi:hypothetical protein
VYATSFLALAPILAYAIDWVGLGLQPWSTLAAALVLAGAAAALLPRRPGSAASDLIAWLAIVVTVTTVLLRLSWPSLVPPGRGPDLTHHLLLVDYIEQHGHLVHDRGLSGAMGEMAHYTPAAHVLAVMAGRWFGLEGLRTIFPLAAVCAALTAGFVFLIARRLLVPVPLAIAATILLLFPAAYFFGAFTHDAFLAQTVATLFSVAMWWAITAWEDNPVPAVAWVVAISLAATFLSWPIFLGPPLLVFISLLWRAELPMPRRQTQFGIVIVPLLAIFLMHSWNRWGWMVIVRTSGAVLHPSFQSLGWLLPLLATAGAIMAFSDRRARITVILLFAIALQALALFIIATAQGAQTPYMALKMIYFAIYPMAVLGAFAVARVLPSRLMDPMGWLVAALLLVAARPALTAPRVTPVVDLDLAQAGQWLRTNGAASCADYLVADAETAYWLHLAVLGNSRSSERMKEVDRYEPRAAMAPWITAAGRPYAIADLRILPDEVRSRVTVITRFGNGAVISGRDATIKGCD